MELLKIEKGIPVIPINYIGKEPEPHPYPFATMQIGDSFFKRCNTKRDWCGYNPDYSHLYNKMYKFCNKINKTLPKDKHMKFVIRTVTGGYRCWRIK